MKKQIEKVLNKYPGAYAIYDERNGRITRYYAVCVPQEYGSSQPGAELGELGFRFEGADGDMNRWER